MKKKLLNYGLGPMVLLIWISVWLRFSSGCNRQQPAVIQGIPVLQPQVLEVTGYTLKLDYPDPFLVPSRSPSSAYGGQPEVQVREVSIQPLQPSLPFTYLGGVSGPRDTEMTGLVRVASRTIPVKTGTRISEWKVKQLSFDTLVVVRNDGRKLWVTRDYHKNLSVQESP